MLLGWQSVDPSEVLVHPQIAQVRAINGQTDWCSAIHLFELGELFTGARFALCKGLVCARVFVAQTFLVQGALQRRRKAHQVVLQDVVIHSLFNALDGGFLSERPRH